MTEHHAQSGARSGPTPQAESSSRQGFIAGPDPTLMRARAAVATLFLTNGAVFANLIPRYPEIKDRLDLSNSAYGLSVAAFPTGAVIVGLAAAPLVRRFTSARVAVAGTVLTSVAMLVASLAPTVGVLAVILFSAGAADACTDVGQNGQGLRVQRAYGRSIINSFHAVWSIGAVLGGLMAAGAIMVGLSLQIHLAISAAAFSTMALFAYRYCLPGSDDGPVVDVESLDDPSGPSVSAGGTPVVLALGALVAIGAAGTVVEDAGFSWATLYLSESLGAGAAFAASGFIAMVGAQFIGRLVGDAAVDRFGHRCVARAGALLAASGMGLALLVPSVPGTVVGFAAAGFGVATLVPAAMHAADELPGLRPGTGLTVVSWLMRIGFLVSPPIIGAVADSTSLRLGLMSVPLAGVVVVCVAGVLPAKESG